MTLADRFAALCRIPHPHSDISEHLPFFVELVAQLDATRILELGVRHGVSTIGWLHALRTHRGGHLWSVDVRFPDDAAPIREVDAPDWTFVLGCDDDPFTLAALPDEVDVVFIDTAHTLEHTTRELELYGWRVRPGGRILLHDTAEYAAGPEMPVRTAIERYVAKRGLTWTDRPFNYGLGVIEVDRRIQGPGTHP